VATKIKLMRLGKMRAPYYRIVVADARTKRDGRSIETIGKYHPKEEPSFIEVDSERAQYWLGVGAQPTEAVAAIFRVTGDWQKFKGEPAPAPMRVAEPKPDKKAIYEAAVRAGMDEPTTDATTAKKKAAPKKAAAAAAPADAEASEAMPPQVDLATDTADQKPAADAAPADEPAADAEASAAMPPQIDAEQPAAAEKPAE
jgi:small subunit ribosomal protein S16